MPVFNLLRSCFRSPRPRPTRRPASRRAALLVEQLEQRTVPDAGLGSSLTGSLPGADPGSGSGITIAPGGPGTPTGPGSPGNPGTPGTPGTPGGTDNTPFLTKLYHDFLHRDPSGTDLAGWNSLLQSGTSPQQVALGVATSDEARMLTIQADYRTYLNRDGAPGELSSWLAAMQAGVTGDQLAASFMSSDEFYAQHGGTDSQWVGSLYGVVLGRAPEAGGLTAWVNALHGGVPRYQVALDFLQSTEAHTFLVADTYGTLLDRAPDPGAGYWVSMLDAGLPADQFNALVASSPEYLSDAANAPVWEPAYLNVQGISPDNGVSSSDGLTDVQFIAAQGNGTPYTPFMVYVDGVVSTRGLTGAGGLVRLSLATPLGQGNHTLSARPVDGSAAGAFSSTYGVSIDVTPPTVNVQAPDFTTSTSPTVTVTAADNYGLGSQVAIDVDLKNDGTFSDPGDQNYATGYLYGGTGTLVLNNLPRGTYNVRARVWDLAGNEGFSAPVPMVVDPDAGYVGSSKLLDLYQDVVSSPGGSGNPGGMYPSGPPQQPSPPGSSAPESLADLKKLLVIDANNNVLVDVHATLPKYLSALETELKQIGFQQTSETPAQTMVSGYLPITAIPSLPALAHFDSVVPQDRAFTRTGAVDSQGDQVLGAQALRNTTGLTGAGVTVGVISDSVNQYQGGIADSQKTGDLPATVNVLKDGSSGDTDEGRAMMEIVYDLAPGAGLAFYTGENSEQDMATGIQALATQAKAKVIVDDIGYDDEPFFNDGVISQAVDQVAAQGVFYASAAGNSGSEGFGANWASTTATVGGTTGTFLDLGAGNALQSITVQPGDSIDLDVQWDSAFLEGGSNLPNYQVPQEIDVILTDSTGSTVLATANDDNTNTNEAWQELQWTNTTSATQFNLSYQLVKGPAPTVLHWIAQENSADPMAAGEGAFTLYGHPEAAGAVAVGAVDYMTPTQPESYSALGGDLPIYFDAAGNRLAQPEIRMKPEVVATDDVDTTFFIPNQDTDGDGFPNFTGTSAAAPHVAAIAALLLQQIPTTSPAVMTAHLEQTAKDLLTPGFDAQTGFGLVQAVTLPPTPVVPPPPGGPGTPGGPTGPTNVNFGSDIFEPNDTSDMATNFGLLGLGTASLSNLTISNHANGQPDYDWFRWTPAMSGTITATVDITQQAGDLELHMFTLNPQNTLIPLGEAALPGATSLTLSQAFSAGEPLLIEVKGLESSPGVWGVGVYNLTVSLS